jgi:peptide/nickel transport system permease protein
VVSAEIDTMTAFLIRRFLISLVVLALVSIISFFIITLTPGSPYPWGDLNPKISKTVKETYRKKFHLDQPLHKQYYLIMHDMFTGKLVSNKDERPVLQKIGERVPYTLLLNGVALVIEFSFGIALGIYGARFRGTWRDKATAVTAFGFIAIPGFWLSYMLCILLVKYVQVPLLGLTTFGVQHTNEWTAFLDRAWHLFAPAFVLSIGSIAVMSRYVRSSMLEALSNDYVRTARAKGLDETTVLYKHSLRNSLRPVVTFIGFSLPALLGGSVIIEYIFSYPGMGRLGYEAVLERDYPVLVSLNLIAATLIVAGNLLSDVLYAVVDPRVRLE